jgi:hypothetical protein
MQSDTPKGDPRLQATSSGPKVATGYVDPCLVYLEAHRPDQRPLLMVCFAAVSREIAEPGKESRLELDDVLVLHCKPHRQSTTKGCNFVLVEEKLLKLENGFLIGIPPECYSLPPKLTRAPISVLKKSIHYLDQETATTLRKRFDSARSPNFPLVDLAKRVVEFVKLDWQSVRQIVYIPEAESRPLQPSLVRRLISSFLKKKPKLVAS